MAINKKLIHFNEKTEFEKRLANNEILDTSIVFVKDSKEIWTHGNYYAGESIDPELLEQIQTSIQELKTNVNDNPFEKGDAEHSAVLKGGNNQTTSECEVALGKYNASNYDTHFSIGIGTSEDDRKNAFEVKQNGDIYIEGVEGRIQDKLDKLVEITYSELKSLRDDSKLIPGQQYRITDYVTTTTQENTRSTGHQFDIIVTADDEKTLNEVARACRSEFDIEKYKDAYSSTLGDKMLYMGTQEYEGKEYHLYEAETIKDQMLVDFSHSLETYPGTEVFYPFKYFPSYARGFDGLDWGVWECGKDYGEVIAFKYEEPNYFDSCKLEAWQLWYSLDNDTERFAWADAENGKGVIYRMIDEFNNDIPYDFTNIQFYHKDVRFLNSSTTENAYVYTFAWCVDPNDVRDAYIHVCNGTLTVRGVPTHLHDNIVGSDYNQDSYKRLTNNVFLYWNDADNYHGFYANTFEKHCNDNVMLTCGWHNYFNTGCFNNKLNENCQRNSFGKECSNNVLGKICTDNSFGSKCLHNSLSYSCANNSFGSQCENNTLNDYCNYNSFGNFCISNNFGSYCRANSFGNVSSHNTLGSNSSKNSFGNETHHNSLLRYSNYNSFGNGCAYNYFSSSRENIITAYSAGVYNNHFDDGCSYNAVWNSNISQNYGLRNININRGVSGTQDVYNFINIKTLNSEKEINVINYNDHIYIDYGDIFKVTYSELVDLRDNSQLIPGRQYRIIDYNTTTSQENTTSAGHPFDIIVTAIDEYTLSEEAQAIQNIIDGYFDESNLSAWKIWYSLDNDTDRFEWAGDERIENEEVEVTTYDSSECTIKSELIDGNTFITPFNFESCVWVDGDGDGVIPYDGGSNHDAAELVYEWGYFTDENDNTHLCIYKSDAGLYEEEGQPDYGDKYLYRGVIDVDGTDYDYWQKWDENGDGLDVQGSADYVFATTPRIVSNPEAYSSETITETIETVIPLEPKGVIYRMIDEFGNDLPYDFKNIMFVRYKLEAPEEYIAEGNDTLWMQQLCNNVRAAFDADVRSFVWAGIADEDKYWEDDMSQILSHTTGENFAFFTFNTDEDTDASLSGNIHGNKMQLSQELPNNVFFGNYCYYNSFGNSCNYNSFGNSCNYNSFGNDCYYNSFGNSCNYNSFGNSCDYNSFGNSCYYNSFGNNCDSNSFGNNCDSNSFGNSCYSNSFGNNCYSNSFGNNCYSNSFGNDCDSNSFGNYCNSNSFGNNCDSNSFGESCSSNSFGKFCENNSFGNYCYNNSFRTSPLTTASLKNYCYYNHFDDGCSYNVIWNSDTTSSSVRLKNININRGVSGTSSAYNHINIDTLNVDYEIQVAKNSKGEIKIYCEADLIA